MTGPVWSWPGAAVGALASAGMLLAIAGLPMNRRPGLMQRLAPYLRDTPRPSRLLTVQGPPRMPLAILLRPVMSDLTRAVERVLGGAASVRRRQQRAGQRPDVDGFRAEQVVWGVLGGLAGMVLAVMLWLRRGGSAVLPAVLVVALAVACGIVARDQLLSYTANRREQRMLEEFPTVAELLALAVGAGEGAIGALERVCRLSVGELSSELGTCLADARAGASLPAALQGLADRTGLASLSRFVDGIVIAVERGTPLADVLRAQAQDVREAGRRAVMEAGGRKEIAMMVPVVFLVLPVTVLFAAYPGLSFLRFDL
ncbi:MAG TPA: type II secretion system F family protein [Dermatophilaceae bacterium]|nr:type II secretion system F family protein [Dermatophilaceae bacterium]